MHVDAEPPPGHGQAARLIEYPLILHRTRILHPPTSPMGRTDRLHLPGRHPERRPATPTPPPDILAAKRRERARIRSGRQQRWGPPHAQSGMTNQVSVRGHRYAARRVEPHAAD